MWILYRAIQYICTHGFSTHASSHMLQSRLPWTSSERPVQNWFLHISLQTRQQLRSVNHIVHQSLKRFPKASNNLIAVTTNNVEICKETTYANIAQTYLTIYPRDAALESKASIIWCPSNNKHEKTDWLGSKTYPTTSCFHMFLDFFNTKHGW